MSILYSALIMPTLLIESSKKDHQRGHLHWASILINPSIGMYLELRTRHRTLKLVRIQTATGEWNRPLALQ